jgi:hypothetical protein
MEYTNYLSHEALARLVAAQGRTVAKVICHLWINRIEKNAPVEIIDNLELHFTDGQKLTISCNETGEALDVINFDFEAASAAIESEFEGKIRMFAVDASAATMWEAVIGLQLQAVKVVKEGEYHAAGSLLLEFNTEKRIICVGPADGLVIDFYEE